MENKNSRRCNNCGGLIQLTRISKSELDINVNGETIFCFNESEERSYFQCSNCNAVSRDIMSDSDKVELLEEISYVGKE